MSQDEFAQFGGKTIDPDNTQNTDKEDEFAQFGGKTIGHKNITTGNSIGRSLAMGAKDTVAGLASIPDFLASPVREALNLGSSALGSDYRFNPLQESISKGIDQVTKGYTAPKNNAERIQSAVQQELVGMLPGAGIGALMKGAKNLGKIGKGVSEFIGQSNKLNASNIGATAGSAAAIQHSQNVNQDNPLSALGMGALGSLLGGASGKGIGSLEHLSKSKKDIKNIIAGNTAEKIGFNPSAYHTFRKADLEPTLADVSNNKILKMTQNVLEHLPLSSGVINKSRKKMFDKMAEGLGIGEDTFLTKEQLAKQALRGIKNYKKSKEIIHNKGFGQFERDLQKIPDINIDPKKSMEFYQKLISNNINIDMQKKFNKSPIGKQLNELIGYANESGGKIPYYQLRQFLDDINDKVTTRGLIGDKSQGELKNLASMINQDIVNGLDPLLKEVGGDAYTNWKNIKKSYHNYAQSDIRDINEMLRAGGKNKVGAIENLMVDLKHGGHKAELLSHALNPKESSTLFSGIMHKMGETDTGFNLGKWKKEFSKLEPEVQNIILSGYLNKHSQKKALAINDAMTHVKLNAAEANTSKSSLFESLKELGKSAWTSGAAIIGGSLAYPAEFASVLLASKLGAEAITNQKLINALYRGMKSKSMHQFNRNLENMQKIKLPLHTLRAIKGFSKDIKEAEKESE